MTLPAARVGDMHVCPMTTGPVPHVGGPILPGCEPTVLIGFMPAARVGDMAVCVGPPDSVKKGEPTVKIGHKEAARLGDPMSHGGVIVAGCPTVIIGSGPQAEALRTDKPFCEECERKKNEREAKKKKRPSRATESS